MNIRTKLLLLMYGIIILTLMVIVSVCYMNLPLYTNRTITNNVINYTGPSNFQNSVRDIYNPNISEIQNEEIVAVINNDSEIIYVNKNFANFSWYRPKSIDELISLLVGTIPNKDLKMTSFMFEGQNGIIVSSNPIQTDEGSYNWVIIPALIILLIVFALPAVFGPIIVRDLRRDLYELETALLLISEGNLDFNIKVKKRNDLKDIMESINSMKNRLKEEESRRQRFFQAVSHDLKTPLTSIKGYIEALQDDIAETKDERDEYYKILDEKTNMLEKRIVSLVDYASFDSSIVYKNFSDYDVETLFTDIDLMIKRDIVLTSHKYVSSIKVDTKSTIKCDERLLVRCFENIYNNAINYCDGNSIISYEVEVIDDKVLINCHNSGSGIEDDVIDTIFEPFSRADKTRNSPGFGLGLASVESIIKLHNGSITAANLDGVLFSIVLPLKIRNKNETRV